MVILDNAALIKIRFSMTKGILNYYFNIKKYIYQQKKYSHVFVSTLCYHLFWKRLLSETTPVFDSLLTGIAVENSIQKGKTLIIYSFFCRR